MSEFAGEGELQMGENPDCMPDPWHCVSCEAENTYEEDGIVCHSCGYEDTLMWEII